MIRFVVFCFCILTLFSAVLGEIVPKFECAPGDNRKCIIKEVRVNPCKDALKTPPGACKVKRSTTADFEVDFVPSFATNNLTAQLYWANGIADVPLPNMERDACKTTQCPTVVDQLQTYTYQMKIEKAYPLGTFEVKFLLNGQAPEDEQCCFNIMTKISK